MKRVLLVDDDLLSRNYLKLLSAWSDAGFGVCADVGDGDEALTVLENEAIDLLVTDLEMPRMGGLELIRTIRKQGRRLCILVLSRHEETACIREVMEAGADGYLLKSALNGAGLYAALCGINARMKAREEERHNAAKSVEKHAGELAAGKQLYFSALLADALSGEERERRRMELGIQGLFQHCAAVVLRPEESSAGDVLADARAEWERLTFRDVLQKGLEKSGFPAGQGELICFAGKFCCFLDLSGIDTGSGIYSLLTQTASVFRELCLDAGLPCAIGVSGVKIGTDAVREAYRQASEALELCFYEKENIAFFEGAAEVSRTLPQEAADVLDRIETLRFRCDRAGFRQCCAEAVAAFRRERTEQALVQQWLRGMLRMFGLRDAEPAAPLMNIDQLPPLLEQIEIRHFHKAKADAPQKLSKPVQTAANFALEHFREQIGLNDAAAAAGVSSCYLSARFGREMGVGFANYLLGLRLGCAERLLEGENVLIQEAAKQAGFRDYHYFCKVFKRRNGVTPAEYRKQAEDRESR